MPVHIVDMIEELKLRRWARLNHRRLTDWDDSLHPVILEELRSIQGEQDYAESSVSLASESDQCVDVSPAFNGRRFDRQQSSVAAALTANPDTQFRNTEYFVHS